MGGGCVSGEVRIVVVCAGITFTLKDTDIGVVILRRIGFLFAFIYFLYSLLLEDSVSFILSLSRCKHCTLSLAIFSAYIKYWRSISGINRFIVIGSDNSKGCSYILLVQYYYYDGVS